VSVAHAIHELFRVTAVRAGDGVRAEHDLHALRTRAAQHVDRWRDPLVERLQRLRVEIEVGALVEIVVQDQQVRIEVRPVLHHQIERRVAHERAVLDRRAAGEDCGACARVANCMNDGAQSDGLRLAAGGFDLRVGHALVAAGAQAGRREQLDDVAAFFFGLADERAERVRIAAAVLQLSERGQHARTGEHASGNPIADDAIDRSANALNRGEAALKRRPCVLGRIRGRIVGFVAAAY